MVRNPKNFADVIFGSHLEQDMTPRKQIRCPRAVAIGAPALKRYYCTLQGSAKGLPAGCVNVASKLKQKW